MLPSEVGVRIPERGRDDASGPGPGPEEDMVQEDQRVRCRSKVGGHHVGDTITSTVSLGRKPQTWCIDEETESWMGVARVFWCWPDIGMVRGKTRCGPPTSDVAAPRHWRGHNI
jgi:hypothetical protein